MATLDPEHRDIFNKLIKTGDIVIISSHGGFQSRLRLGTVQKINPKMINVIPIDSKLRKVDRRYGEELLVVTNDPRVSAWVLMNCATPLKKRGNK